MSPERLIKKFERDYEDIARFTLEEINKELDNNMNDIIILLNRRKSLIMNKKKKLKTDFYFKTEELKRMPIEDL